MTTINLTKELKSALQYVKRACNKDKDREVLQHVNVNGKLIGCDGHRLHAVNTKIEELDNGNYSVELAPGHGFFELHEKENYPDLSSVYPTKKPIAEFYVNPVYLREALAGLSSITRVVVYDETMPVAIYGMLDDGITETYALVMPMHNNDYSILSWRPTK